MNDLPRDNNEDILTPALVRAVLLGEDPDDHVFLTEPDSEGLFHIDPALSDYFVQNTQLGKRCLTCGLIGACWCQPNCEHCRAPHPHQGLKKVRSA